MPTWRSFPKRSNKVILLGQNARTRERAPWESEHEIWTLNEAPASPWLKRYDRLFQIHPRSDWERVNNMADPNHALYIRGLSDACKFCDGTGKATLNGADAECPHCRGGRYELPDHRYQAPDAIAKPIYMQEAWRDVPNGVELPLSLMVADYCQDGRPYFTSTFAYMLVFAAGVMGYDEIECYGFGMESDTEYANQRPCAEYWAGFFRARGTKITAPGSGLFSGPIYGYEDKLTGLRTRYELRRRALEDQLARAKIAAFVAQGAFDALEPFRAMPELAAAYDQRFQDHWDKKGFATFLTGTIKELDAAIAMLDAYNPDDPDHIDDMRRLIELPYSLG